MQKHNAQKLDVVIVADECHNAPITYRQLGIPQEGNKLESALQEWVVDRL